MKKALLVVDMQNVCVGENYASFFKYDNEHLIAEVNKVIEQNKDNSIIYVRNIMKHNFINKFAPFHAYEGTKEVELADKLLISSENVYDKFVGDVFSNEKFVSFLRENSIDTVELIGIDGGGCVSISALGAIRNGYKVIVNTKAIGTMFHKKKEKYYKKLKNLGATFV